ncbi:MAG TPA: cbb3-type cytochrome c oxidase subunit I [Candidatus Saccharimonadales bacterium]|nr:cbb3-type cytochrome c oxidase subunit I [Candidatus Saccharimonadales bacterium]
MNLINLIFGRMTLNDLPHAWFTIGGTASLIGLGALGAALLTYLKRWKWIWNEWITSTDPKKIGIMYFIVAAFMFLRGLIDAGMIWLQQSLALGTSYGYLSASHFQQIFTSHGDIMVFFATMGFLVGFLNLVMPLQIGARDLAFPFLNSLGFWLYVAGAILMNMFFVFGGEFAAAGWLAQAPLSELQFSPGVGVDYWIWSLQVSGLGTLLAGINFLVTIVKMRAPGMTLMRMPLFVWTTLCSSVLIITVFPVLAITITMLTLDRYLGMNFFTTGNGGNSMMYINLIWMWGHPEVYILILPGFGIFSEVVSTFSHKKLAGYTSLVLAAISVALLALMVWLHHFFTMGAGADVNAFFGISTMFIAVPTGVQILNWIFTMFRGKIAFKTPMYWFLGFVSTFTFGGMAGVLMASPAADFQLHNSLFLVAHFHTMIIGGALFGIFSGITYWFPKFFGFKLNERIGKYAFWCWIVGFFLSFIPLYILGFMGVTRRLDHYINPAWRPLFITSGIGFTIIMIGALLQVVQILVSIKQKKQNYDTTGDPWDGRSLEWATSSPPPFYNFAIIPEVKSRDAFWEMKKKGIKKITKYEDITLPKNTPMGLYVSGFIFLFGFAMVWHMTLLAIVGFLGAITCVIIRTFDEDTEYVLKASEVEKIEMKRKNL